MHNLVKDARKVQKSILLIGEISDIYVNSFQKMLSDENYTPDELSAIAYGYTQLLQESSDVLEEMKSVVNINGLSMSDKERMDVIDRTYNAIRNYRDLVSYLYPQEYFRFLPAGEKEKGHRPGNGFVRLGG